MSITEMRCKTNEDMRPQSFARTGEAITPGNYREINKNQ